MGSNRSFGVVFSVVFLIISFWPLFTEGTIRIWAIFIAILFLLISYFKPDVLYPLNKIWFKFGLLLGSIVSPIVMGIVFFIIVTPIGLIMRIIGKDLLNKKINRNYE